MGPLTTEPNHDDPLWYKDAVIYQLHIKAFADSDGDGIGDFGGLTSRLDYLQELGVTALWLLPFYPSPLRDDGYDIADYESVHSAYGDLTAFRRFLKEAHTRGLRVITELVINHTSDEHAWFKRARRSPKGSPYRNFYVWSDTPDRYAEARIIFQDFETSNWSWDPVADQYYWHRFYSHQPDLNFDNPAVHRAVLRVLDKWLGMGVDGVRLDAIPYLYEREGTNCENLPETHIFLKKLRAHVDANHPNRLLLAEANQWPEDAVAYFGEGDGDECHMAFHFPVMPRLYMALQMEDRRPIVDILEQTPPLPAKAQWAMFLRNHDELTLEMVTDEERDYMYRTYASDPRARINLGIRRRLAPLLQKDRRKMELLNALVCSLPGTPVIYYGDEIGMGDNVYLGDRDGVRTPMQWSADRNAGFSRANPQQLYLPVVVDPQYHYETLNVEAQHSNPSSFWWWMHRVIALRTRHRVFGRGGLEFLQPDNPKVLAFLRTPRPGEEGDEILVVANLARHAQAVELDLRARAGLTPIELFGQTPFATIGELPYYLTLGPYGFYWFRLARAPQASPAPRAPVPAAIATLPASALLNGRRRTVLERALAEWLPQQSFFNNRSRTVRSVNVVDSIDLAEGLSRSPLELLMVSVDFTQGESELYSVPVRHLTGEAADRLIEDHPDLVIARVRGRDGVGAGVLADAMADPDVALALAQVAARQRSRKGQQGEIEGTGAVPLRRLVRMGHLDVSLLATDQSSTSVLLGNRAIVKLYRRLEPGASPDLEIGRHLRLVGFDHAASLVGAVEYARRRGEAMTVAVLHDYVANEGDAWRYALDRLAGFFEHVATIGTPPAPAQFPPGLFAADPVPQAIGDLVGPFLAAAEQIGRRTAEMHTALSWGDEPGFAPEPFTTLYQRSLYQSMLNEVRATLRQVRARRSPALEPFVSALDGAVEARVYARLDRLRRGRIDTVRTRVHGHYHLAQVLRSGSDFVIVDFEGEPTRSVGQRRIKRSPLRDVAAMLASFGQAVPVALAQTVERGVMPDLATAGTRLGEWGRLWLAWTTGRFVFGYLAQGRGQPFVPESADDLRLLVDLYLLEHLSGLVREEIDRPARAAVAVHALVDLIAGFPE